MRRGDSTIFSNHQTDAVLNILGGEQAAAWARFYAIEVDSRPGELEYDRALAAAKKLDAAVAEIVAAAGGRPKGDWPFFEPSQDAGGLIPNYHQPRAVGFAPAAHRAEAVAVRQRDQIAALPAGRASARSTRRPRA